MRWIAWLAWAMWLAVGMLATLPSWYVGYDAGYQNGERDGAEQLRRMLGPGKAGKGAGDVGPNNSTSDRIRFSR